MQELHKFMDESFAKLDKSFDRLRATPLTIEASTIVSMNAVDVSTENGKDVASGAV